MIAKLAEYLRTVCLGPPSRKGAGENGRVNRKGEYRNDDTSSAIAYYSSG